MIGDIGAELAFYDEIVDVDRLADASAGTVEMDGVDPVAQSASSRSKSSLSPYLKPPVISISVPSLLIRNV